MEYIFKWFYSSITMLQLEKKKFYAIWHNSKKDSGMHRYFTTI